MPIQVDAARLKLRDLLSVTRIVDEHLGLYRNLLAHRTPEADPLWLLPSVRALRGRKMVEIPVRPRREWCWTRGPL